MTKIHQQIKLTKKGPIILGFLRFDYSRHELQNRDTITGMIIIIKMQCLELVQHLEQKDVFTYVIIAKT